MVVSKGFTRSLTVAAANGVAVRAQSCHNSRCTGPDLIMQWSTPEGPLQDDLVGAFTPDGTLVAGADAEGTYSFKLADPVTLDYRYAEDGDGFRTTCARLQKQV